MINDSNVCLFHFCFEDLIWLSLKVVVERDECFRYSSIAAICSYFDIVLKGRDLFEGLIG